MKLLDEIVNDATDDIKGLIEKFTITGSSSSSITASSSSSLTPMGSNIVYQYTNEKVTNQLLIRPFGVTQIKEIELTRILNLIQFDLLDNHSDVNLFLVEVSRKLNNARRIFFNSTSDNSVKEEYWLYPSLLRFIRKHFYNNSIPFSYGKPSASLYVSCNLFTFEYLMSLFIQFTRYLTEAKEKMKERNYEVIIECYENASDILEYMTNTITMEQQEEELDKFLYIPSPNAISSSNSNGGVGGRHFITTQMVKQDLSIIIDYFGGKHALPMLNQLVKAQLFETLYDCKRLKLGTLSDKDHINMYNHFKTHVQYSMKDYEKLFQFSKSVQYHYDEAWKLLEMSPNLFKTKLYYFVLFLKHYWFCRHHFTIMVYDYYLYNDVEVKDLRIARSILSRSRLVITTHNEFIKYNLFDRTESKIISSIVLTPYQSMIESTVQLCDEFNTCCDNYSSGPLDVGKLKSFEKLDLPSSNEGDYSKTDEKLDKHFNESINSIPVTKLQKLNESYFNPTKFGVREEEDLDEEELDYHYEDVEEGITRQVMTDTENATASRLHERQLWLEYLSKRIVNNVIIINEEETAKIQQEIESFIL